MMTDAAEMRRRAKQQYEAVRRSLDAFGRSVAGDGGEGTPVRAGFGWLTGPLDVLAGWLLADDEITRRGQGLIERAWHPPGDRRHEAGGPGGGAGRVARDGGAEAAREPAGEPGPLYPPVSSVDVVFTLPAEVRAGTVALCGEFNEWSAGDIQLQRGGDGTWRPSWLSSRAAPAAAGTCSMVSAGRTHGRPTGTCPTIMAAPTPSSWSGFPLTAESPALTPT